MVVRIEVAGAKCVADPVSAVFIVKKRMVGDGTAIVCQSGE